MTLSDERIYECERLAAIRYVRHTGSIRGQMRLPADDLNWHFARAIEAEVHKQDDALILQLVEALEKADKISGYPNNRKTITAANARLENT